MGEGTDRLQIQEDRWEIQQVLNRYCENVDRHDWAAMGEVFTKDTVGIYNGIEQVGLETLISVANENMSRTTIAQTQHNVSNPRIEIEGDNARCVTNYYAVHLGAGVFENQIYTMWGEYDDKLVRTGQGWRIARRDYYVFTDGDDRMVFAGKEPQWADTTE